MAAFLNAGCFVRLELLIVDVFSQCNNDDGNRALLVSPSDDDECSSGSVECQLHSDCVIWQAKCSNIQFVSFYM